MDDLHKGIFHVWELRLRLEQSRKKLRRIEAIMESAEYRASHSKKEYQELREEIQAVKTMQEVFEAQAYFSIEIKGSEGRKDTRRDGIESPDLYGSYGPVSGIRVEIVNDAVEGTKFASGNTPGATSVLAAALDQKNG